MKPLLSFQLLGVLFLVDILHCQALVHRRTFVYVSDPQTSKPNGTCQLEINIYKPLQVKEVPYTRLCSTKNILTVNGQFPGPTLYARKGDTIIVDVHNKGNQNITIHWHGVKQPRNPWSDGPEYITQCPIQPGAKFSQKIILSTEEGTLWWHAHSEWDRATVCGALVIYPKKGTNYPFSKPHAEFPLILGEWWKEDIEELYTEFLKSGGDPNISDALTINGQPGDLYPCSKPDTFKLMVEHSKTYLLRLINSGLQDILFFSIANHSLTIVGSDASYTKPFVTNYIAISPGQTIDFLLTADQDPHHHYYMGAKVYTATSNPFDNTTTTALLHYGDFTPSNSPPFSPYLAPYNDTNSSVSFTGRLRSLADKIHSVVDVPLNINDRLFFTLSINTFPCRQNDSCQGPNGSRLAASVNNVSFVTPTVNSILQAYYYHANGVFGDRFPDFPETLFDFTATDLPLYLETPKSRTEVKVLEYNSTVEIVFQGTNVTAGAADHPMHLHGFSFYVVGWGFGNFDKDKDPLNYNLVDPPLQNTIAVPVNGWTTVRFKADNPGVWFMHCHVDRHMSWGMTMAFIVKNGKFPNAQILPPPPDMPPC
ncbi:laccase-15 isoform X1 [Ziziphus jujuba]|uniref:Laccase n=1 Tax=Ziziphus jujuba TaxID=326968 RepID=A0ABM3ID63_ZIZJJ|nr:laccase-15 isoform X1 [Ziziphus jujuba]